MLRENCGTELAARKHLNEAAQLGADPLDYAVHRFGLGTAIVWGRAAEWAGVQFAAVTPSRIPAPSIDRLDHLGEVRSFRQMVLGEEKVFFAPGFAQVLMWLTGQHDVAFGTTVSGRPAEVPGADSMVGLFINTVPVRGKITAATTASELLGQLQSAHNDVLEHQHLALSEIHRVAGQDHLFDTFFVYENYPLDAAALSGTDGLAVTEFVHREYNHYPLAVQAMPDTELRLRIEFDTDVFDAADVETLVGRFERVLAAMTADPQRRLSSVDVLSEAEHAVARFATAPEYARESRPALIVKAAHRISTAKPDADGEDIVEGAFADQPVSASTVLHNHRQPPSLEIVGNLRDLVHALGGKAAPAALVDHGGVDRIVNSGLER